MNNNQQIDDILKNIREIMDEKNDNKREGNEERKSDLDTDIIELSDDLTDENHMQLDNGIYMKDEDGTEEHQTKDDKKSVINLTKQTVVADVSSKINDFLMKAHNVNKEKRDNRGLDLEDLVSSLIIPYLSDWLNKNLPHMVEEILKREIRKLIDK